MAEAHKDHTQLKYTGENRIIDGNELFEVENISDIELSKWKILTITGIIRDSDTLFDKFSFLLKNTKNIEEINFTDNKLHKIPNSICNLIYLKK